jgi:hypothetical protein
MSIQINELVDMRDIETLFEVMENHDDWFVRLEAAEGLVKLGDVRGLESLLISLESEDEDIRSVAKEILETPLVSRMKEDIEAEARRALISSIENAKNRLTKGQQVFTYRMIYFSSGEILSENTTVDGFRIFGLDKAGLDGWEVVNVIPRRRQLLVGGVDDHFVGAYFLLKKQMSPDESAELDELL